MNEVYSVIVDEEGMQQFWEQFEVVNSDSEQCHKLCSELRIASFQFRCQCHYHVTQWHVHILLSENSRSQFAQQRVDPLQHTPPNSRWILHGD
jgi:hypothetical protein